jgi:hypothetical protein
MPQRIQGFDVDDVFDAEAISTAETKQGVDGHLAGGFVYEPVKMGIHLMADSDSNNFFETWGAANRSLQDSLIASGIADIPSIGRTYILTRGFLTAVPMLPSAKKTLAARTYQITWESVTPAPR